MKVDPNKFRQAWARLDRTVTSQCRVERLISDVRARLAMKSFTRPPFETESCKPPTERTS